MPSSPYQCGSNNEGIRSIINPSEKRIRTPYDFRILVNEYFDSNDITQILQTNNPYGMKKTVPKLNHFVRLHIAEIVLYLMVLVYIILFASLSFARHWWLGSYYYDLGIMHQVVYNTAQGWFLQLTDPESTKQILRFAIHFDPLMIIFAPFYWFYPRAEVLLLGQTIFLASGAIPIYRITQHVFKKYTEQLSIPLLGLFFAALYLMYYPLQNTNMFDFHPVALVTPLLLWAFYYIETARYTMSFVVIILALLGKENVALITGMLGIYMFLFKKKYKLGFIVSTFSAIVLILVMFVIIPSQRTNLHFASSYISTDISINIQRLFSFQSFQYLYSLLQPLGFVSLLSPLHLVIALPEFFINLLSKNENMRNLLYHYTSLITPFIFISSIFGLRRIYTLLHQRIPSLYGRIIFYICCVLILFSTIQTNFTYGPFTRKTYSINTKRLAIIDMWREKLKDDTIKVAASGHLGPHLSGRKYFYNFLFDFAYMNFNMTLDDLKKAVTKYEVADYVILQRAEMDNPDPAVQYYYNHLKTNSKYQMIFNEEGIEVYKKII